MKATINVEVLKSIILTNRNEHHEQFLEAVEVYRRRAITELEDRMERIEAGDLHVWTHIPVPEEHTDDYDNVLRLLDLHTEPTIELAEEEIRTYVQNEWGWLRSFAANTTMYLGKDH